MTQAILAGMLLAGGIWLAWSGAFPAPEPLSAALARLSGPTEPVAATTPGEPPGAFGRWLVRQGPVATLLARVRTDLRLLRRTPEQHATTVAVYMLVGLLWVPTVAAGALLLGIEVPVLVPLWLALGGALLGGLLPHRQVRKEAGAARAAFLHALSAYCDVAGMAMSAGHETYAALFDAADAGDGPAFAEMREALEVGFLTDEKPWVSLQALGTALGVDDLVELGATVALAGDEGAAVRDTVATRARSIRERLITDAEKQASSATERMAIPGAMLLIGFLWFLTFPALSLILSQAR
jgi:Flp pilus assembly protein TadB